METLVGLIFAASPLALTAALLVMADRRANRVHAEVARQIALTDALHARLGALVAPVVRRRAGVWQITVAVPIERPAVVGVLLTTADEVFGRVAYELRLQRQLPLGSATHARRAAPAVRELSWT
jgi:hypothetical protein